MTLCDCSFQPVLTKLLYYIVSICHLESSYQVVCEYHSMCTEQNSMSIHMLNSAPIVQDNLILKFDKGITTIHIHFNLSLFNVNTFGNELIASPHEYKITDNGSWHVSYLLFRPREQ